MIPLPGTAISIGRQFINLSNELTTAVLLTIDAGWDLALLHSPQLNSQADEVTITERLRDAMRAALISRDLPWRNNMVILPGTESRSQPGMAKPDGRTDIPLFFTPIFSELGEHDPHAIIECKRVSEGDGHLTREYVIEGVDRFKIGKYAGNHAKGFMIGYVLSGRKDAIVLGINNYLNSKKRVDEMLDSTGIEGVIEWWRSKHPRGKGKQAIAIHHMLLSLVAMDMGQAECPT